MKVFFNILLILISAVSIVQAQSNGNKGQFDLNDPRNPDCPCHKMQQQAEQEFNNENDLNAFVGQLGNISKENATDDSDSSVEKADKIKSSSFTATGQRHTRKHKVNGFQKRIFRTVNRHRVRKKVKPNYAVCYKW